jgi:hypothetical protein
MRNHLVFRSRYALAALVVAGGLGVGVACAPAKPPPPPTGLSISPTSKDFNSLGVNDPASAAQTFTVKNNASATSGVLTVALGPDFDPGEFVLSADTCSTTTLPAGLTCTVDVAFDPNTTGDKAAEVVAKSANASDGTAKAIVLGTGTP